MHNSRDLSENYFPLNKNFYLNNISKLNLKFTVKKNASS